nr:hypothetical protein CKG001_10030 [Bdellovibrio sp. CKG001]
MSFRTYLYDCVCGHQMGVNIPDNPNPLNKDFVGPDCMCGRFAVVTPKVFHPNEKWEYDVIIAKAATKRTRHKFPVE